MKERGKVRRSAIISTFGPGSVVDFRSAGGAVSAVVAGIDEWEGRQPGSLGTGNLRVQEPRLERALNVSYFVLPPVVAESWTATANHSETRPIPIVRFPQYLQCPRCNRIAPQREWGADPGRNYRYCKKCTRENPGREKVFVYPVRFVMACEKGHLDEFPWEDWVGHKSDCTHRWGKFLKLESRHPGLSGLILSCPKCGAYRTMDGIFSAERMRKYRCRGKRPWLSGDDEECDRDPRVVQRGASNIYFPATESALSIPPWSDPLQQALGIYWRTILDTRPSDRETFIRILAGSELAPILRNLQMTPEELVAKINQRVNWYSGDEILDLRWAEYQHFVSGVGDKYTDHEFEIRNEKVPDLLKPYFTNIVRAVRLREIRAIRGFTRIQPPGGDENDTNIAPISLGKKDWLPAIEVRGEGIFLEINTERLKVWEKNPDVLERATTINHGWQEEYQTRYRKNAPFYVTPRFLLVHTFSHALMRQLTLECGYSGASLSERLYVRDENPEMCGVLVYTATSDSDGTLGGLQRQGLADRIALTIRGAIRAMEWCSSDPLCIEGMTAARESHSMAACHACCLAPETSCEHFNKFLDRGMLIGIPENPETGFFNPFLREG